MSLETNYGRWTGAYLLYALSTTFLLRFACWILRLKKPKAKNVDLDGLEGKGKNSKETQICLQDKKYTTNLQIWFDSVLWYNSGSEKFWGIFKK